MADTVSTSVTPSGDAITWASAGTATWASPVAVEKTWETAAFQTGAWEISVAVALNIDEVSANKELGKNITEALRLVDLATTAADFDRVFNEALSIDDGAGTVTTFDRVFEETLTIEELMTPTTDFVRAFSEALRIIEASATNTNFDRVFDEAFAIGDSMATIATFDRNFAETLDISDSVGKDISIFKTETLKIIDAMLQNSNAVISDLLINSGEMTPEAFTALLKKGRPEGFGEYARFSEGDMTYKRALVKAILKSANSARLRLTKLQAIVDVPDVNDTGSATITAGGTRVSFNREYIDPPEVVANIKAGTVLAIPKIQSIDELGFVVELFDLAGNSVDGVIAWSAQGY